MLITRTVMFSIQVNILLRKNNIFKYKYYKMVLVMRNDVSVNINLYWY